MVIRVYIFLFGIVQVLCEDWEVNCPDICRCTVRKSLMTAQNLRTVDCANAQLINIPDNLPRGAESVDFSRNTLSSNNDNIAQLRPLANLTELDLSACRITSLDQLELDIATLQILRIDHNDLDYLAERSLWHLHNLRILHLAYNKIETMHSEGLYGLRSLRSLDLSHNRLYTICPSCFTDLITLEFLDLSHNSIHILRSRTLSEMPSLTHLDLSHNLITHIQQESFYNLLKLQEIDLNNNRLELVPTEEIQYLTSLQTLDLSSNYFHHFVNHSFSNAGLATLKLTEQPKLEIIDNYAFFNLENLEYLDLSSNPRLQYIDFGAITLLPRLSFLNLSSNNLTSFSEYAFADITTPLTIKLANNPLLCDCNLAWATVNVGNNNSLKIDNARCFKDGHQMTLTSTEMLSLPNSCVPRLIPLFNSNYEVILGDSLQLNCRAVGTPRPVITWTYGESAESLQTSITSLSAGRAIVTSSGSLVIDYIRVTDHGLYTCEASNPLGKTRTSVRVHVRNMRAAVLVLSVRDTSVTITWKSIEQSHDYQLLIRPDLDNATWHSVDITAFMRSYTFSNLQPSSSYELCIALSHSKIVLRLNCTHVVTRLTDLYRVGILNIRPYVIGGVAGALALIIILSVTMSCFVRRYNRRQRQQVAAYGDHNSQLFLASMDALSDTTPITYENQAVQGFDDDDIADLQTAPLDDCHA